MLLIRNEVAHFEDTLRRVGTPRRAEGEKRYLKSDLTFLGATKPDVRRAVRAWLKSHSDVSREELVRLVRALWRKPIHELRMTGILLMVERVELLGGSDLSLLEELLRRSKTWAYVDEIAVRVVGPLIGRDRRLTKTMDRWARDDDFWIRRSAMLALLLPIRQGGGDWKRFTRFADSMLEEKEFFIRKAIGWILREASKTDPGRVAAFLEPRLDRTSSLTFREATKYLPATVSARLEKLRR